MEFSEDVSGYFVDQSLDPSDILELPQQLEQSTTTTFPQKPLKSKVRQYPAVKKTDTTTNTTTGATPEQPSRPRKAPTWADIKAPEPAQKPTPKPKPVVEEVRVFGDVTIGNWSTKKKIRVSAFDDLMKTEKEADKPIIVATPSPAPKKPEERRKLPRPNMPINVANIAIPGAPVVPIPARAGSGDSPFPVIICTRP